MNSESDRRRPGDLRERYKEYSLRANRMYCALPRGNGVARAIGVRVLQGCCPDRGRADSGAPMASTLRSSLLKTRTASEGARASVDEGDGLLQSGTLSGARRREASKARSNAGFTSKMEGELQELEETGCWLDLLEGGEVVASDRMAGLLAETDELIAVFFSPVRTATNRKSK